MSTRFTPSFVKGASTIISSFFQAAAKAAPKVVTGIMSLSEENDDDEDYVDPTPEEILDWMYADEDSRPEEDQYGEF